MYKPLDKLIITQRFGDNPEYYSKFGLKGHEGIDFKTKGIGNTWGSWYDFVGWRNVYAVKAGTVEVIYSKGAYGTHIYLTDEEGNKFLYAHLKNAKCQTGWRVKEGQVIAISGNSGNTTGPHLHFCYKPKNFNQANGFNGFENPLPLFYPTLDVAVVNMQYSPINEFKSRVIQYTDNKVEFDIKSYSADISVINGTTLNTTQAMELIDRLDIKERFIFILYPSNNSAYEVASYHPARNAPFATIPYPCYATVMVHSFLHLLRDYINQNRLGPHIEDVERYPTSWSDAANFGNTGWRFEEQYSQLGDYLINL